MTNPDDAQSTQVIPTQSAPAGSTAQSPNGAAPGSGPAAGAGENGHSNSAVAPVNSSLRQRSKRSVGEQLVKAAGGGPVRSEAADATATATAATGPNVTAVGAAGPDVSDEQPPAKPPKAAKPPKPAKPPKAPKPRSRRARLAAVRLDPWSVMKTAFMLSIALGIMTVACVLVVWNVLNASGVFDSINTTVADILGSASTTKFDVMDYVGFQKVAGFTALICVVDVVLITALATLGAFLYNLSASLLGGVEVTLAEDD